MRTIPRPRTVLATLLASAVVAVLGAAGDAAAAPLTAHHVAAVASAVSNGGSGRLVGSFKLRGVITTAVNVRGETRGQHVVRLWRFEGRGCRGSICSSVRLRRQRAAGIYDWITLRRQRGGSYRGSSVFYTPLKCLGRVYRHGSRDPYSVSVTISGAVRIGGVGWADAIRATYVNRRRIDTTPCPMGVSHDAASYHGSLISARPLAPTAAFTDTQTQGSTFTFSSSVTRGSGGPVGSYKWNFGDSASGSADSSSAKDPSHTFSAAGTHTVTLTIGDRDGMHASVRHTVRVS